MFDVSLSELLVVMVVVLLVFGPGKLPEAAHKLGHLMGQLRLASNGLRREFYQALYLPPKDDSRQLTGAPAVPENRQEQPNKSEEVDGHSRPE